jgi:hypothetical protein
VIYLVGGAPRAGKSVLGQRVAQRLNIGWVATDVLRTLVKGEGDERWDASPEAITRVADFFFPYLEKFVGGMSSCAEHYLIEGVHFLPRHVVALGQRCEVRAVFIGSSQLTLERFEQFPGRSPGYAGLPADFKRQIVQDVPRWSHFIAAEAAAAGCPYVDTSGDFAGQLAEAERQLEPSLSQGAEVAWSGR